MNVRRPAPPNAPLRATEMVYGLRAGLAVFSARREDILAIRFSRAVVGELAELLAWARASRRPADEMHEADLDRFAGSSHHEGLCVETQPRRWTSTRELAQKLVAATGVAVALDRVRNPYNVGAILRSAAFFGVDGVILGAPAPHPALAPDAVRVAEGGAEHLHLARTTDLADTLGRVRDLGVRVVGADGAADTALTEAKLTRPLVLVMGHEREGLSARVRAMCDGVVAIRGSGRVESLNVAVAASVLIAAVAPAEARLDAASTKPRPGPARPR